jgi:hypothetical protein
LRRSIQKGSVGYPGADHPARAFVSELSGIGHDRPLVLGSQFAQKQALAATDDSRTAHAVNASVWPGLRSILFTSS